MPDRTAVSADKTTAKPRYVPGLDVMRGLAISMVLVYHAAAQWDWLFYQTSSRWALRLRDVLQAGAYGVHLFFILSGFLITGILVDSRTQPDYYRNFYMRRILRIVPAYLLMLFVLLLTHSITARYLAVCLLYFCNMTAIFGAKPEYGPLWSLSVEEQFYLVWPFIVRKLSVRALLCLSAALIVATPLLRFVLLCGPAALHDVYYKTWAVLDFFAAGSCLAIAIRNERFRKHLARATGPFILGGALLLCLFGWLPTPAATVAQRIVAATQIEPWLLLFTGLILLAYLKPRMALAPVARPLIFLANISYGLYLYHVFLFHLVVRYWPQQLTASLTQVHLAIVQVIVQIAISIAIAYVSRNTLEEFFLRLKPKHTLAPAPRELKTKIT